MDLWHVLFVALANVRTLPVLELNLSLDRLEKREREREREPTKLPFSANAMNTEVAKSSITLTLVQSYWPTCGDMQH